MALTMHAHRAASGSPNRDPCWPMVPGIVGSTNVTSRERQFERSADIEDSGVLRVSSGHRLYRGSLLILDDLCLRRPRLFRRNLRSLGYRVVHPSLGRDGSIGRHNRPLGYAASQVHNAGMICGSPVRAIGPSLGTGAETDERYFGVQKEPRRTTPWLVVLSTASDVAFCEAGKDMARALGAAVGILRLWGSRRRFRR